MSQQNHNRPGPPIRVTVRPPGDVPDPADAPFAVERLAALGHDLGNLLDGSMRCLSLARRSLGNTAIQTEEERSVQRHLGTVYGALERMADLVHAAMKGSSSVVGSATLCPSQPITLETAITHAADVVGPEAAERGIQIVLSISPDAAALSAGPLYSVILNGLRNAIESIVRAQPRDVGVRTGSVEVSATLKPVGPVDDASIDLVLLEIRDDGRGLPGTEDPNRAFDFGYTTKPGGAGVGLALAREVVREYGGMIELVRRTDRGSPTRPGAILKVAYPMARKGTRG